MHPFSVLTLGIFIAGYTTARWDLVTRLYELAIFAIDHGVLTRATKGFAILSIVFSLFIVPARYLASLETQALLGASLPASNFGDEDRLKSNAYNDMVALDGLLRIFWPSDCSKVRGQGVVIGWRNAQLDVFVIAIIQDVDYRRVQNALSVGSIFRGSEHGLEKIYKMCGASSMQALGTLNSPEPSSSFDPSHLVLRTGDEDAVPYVYCPRFCGISVQFVLFDRPSPYHMEFMSYKPISLVLADETSENPFTLFNLEGESSFQDTYAEERKNLLKEKLKYHTVRRHYLSQKEKLLPSILAQINCSSEVAQLIDRNTFVLRPRPKRSLSVGEQVAESAVTITNLFVDKFWNFTIIWLWPTLIRLFVMALVCHRVVAECVLQVLEWRPRQDSAALKDISATAQQVDIRLQQFSYWPIQYLTLRKRREDWLSITDKHSEYIRFYNSLWLVANDVIIGIAVGSYIIDNAEWVALQINNALNDWTIGGLMNMIYWLRDWPAGLKLNNELAVFLGDLVLFMVKYWRTWVISLEDFLPAVIYFIGFASFAGATMPIAMFSDLLSLLTVHIYCFYTASARIFSWQLSIIMSLFHLFRGKKHNVLRNRIDSCDYDLDQLLLGTILFTLLFFLLPTVAVFYLTFTSARMAIIVLKAGQDTLLACLNHFPIFAVMLRIKDSRRVPGGISFVLKDVSAKHAPAAAAGPDCAPTSYIVLKDVPLPLRAVFDQYFRLGNRIRRHYLSPRVIWCLLTGRFLPPIHRKSMYSLQYSMLPTQRAGVGEMWQLFNESLERKGFQKKGAYANSSAKTSSSWFSHSHRKKRSR